MDYSKNIQTLRKWLLLALIATLLGVVTGSLYFSYQGIWAPISDASGMLIGITLIPCALGMHRYLVMKTNQQSLSMLTMIVGLVGFILFTLAGAALILFYFDETLPGLLALNIQFGGGGLQGVWLILLGLISLQTKVFTKTAGWMALLAGIGYLTFGLTAIIDTSANPAVMTAAGIGLILFIIWVVLVRQGLNKDMDGD